MKIVAVLLALSIFFLMMMEAISFRKSILCRQELWLKAVELRTRSLLSVKKNYEKLWNPKCKFIIMREGDSIIWRKFPKFINHSFELNLKGKL